MADVFVSYTRSDQIYLQQLVAFLERAGLTVWWDDHIGPRDFRDEIAAQLNQSKAAIVIWTSSSIQSSFVRDEAELAMENEKLIQVLAKDLSPNDLPLGFRSLNALRWGDWEGLSSALGHFIQKIDVPVERTQRSHSIFERLFFESAVISLSLFLLVGIAVAAGSDTSQIIRDALDMTGSPGEGGSPLISESQLVVGAMTALTLVIFWRIYSVGRLFFSRQNDQKAKQ